MLFTLNVTDHSLSNYWSSLLHPLLTLDLKTPLDLRHSPSTGVLDVSFDLDPIFKFELVLSVLFPLFQVHFSLQILLLLQLQLLISIQK